MKAPAHTKPDERWCEIMADYAAQELVAGKIITEDKLSLAKKIIQQEAYLLLISNVYPAGDLNSN